jgi:hypothetical protein
MQIDMFHIHALRQGAALQKSEALVHLLRCDVLQLKTSHLRSKAAQSLLAPLQRLITNGASSISVPYVMHDVSASSLLYV